MKRIMITLLAAWMLLFVSACAAVPVKEQTPVRQGSKDEENLMVHFLDVGQADCILIESGGSFMLVDAGNNEDGELILQYLKDAGVKKLEYVIGTHPHEDHIGSLDTVIDNFDVSRVILPKISHTTKTYEDVLTSISGKGLKITQPVAGDTYSIGNAAFTILAPNGEYGNELNNWSVGLRLVYGDTAFVMAGDAEEEAEHDICANGLELKADVLKLGHHGSRTSSCEEFLEQVTPTYAVISCGRDNDYGHPHAETIEKLERLGISAFRTDLQGAVIAESDGTQITWSADPIISGQEGEKTAEYVLNTSTKKFHKPDCSSVDSMKQDNKEEYTGSRQQLIKEGYSPCGVCKP